MAAENMKITNTAPALRDLGDYFRELPDEAKSPVEYKKAAYALRKKKHDGVNVFRVVLGASIDGNNSMVVPSWVYGKMMEQKAVRNMFAAGELTATAV